MPQDSEMFDIEKREDGTIALIGRCHAGFTEDVREKLQGITDSCVIDFESLDYIASAGLGVLLAAQKRLKAAGGGLVLANLNPHIREVFRIAGFDKIFEIR